jgi:hypothetical protein
MRKTLLALVLTSASALAVPAAAQTNSEQQRWEAAQARYQSETDLYQRERDRYMAARARSGGGYDDNYQGRDSYQSREDYAPPPSDSYRDPNGYSNRDYSTDYDAARDYRDDPRYRERRLSSDDMVYRGSDGRYYCKRSDGTTGLIVGGVGGAVLGNVIDGGRNRVAGTLIGGALGALAGQAVDRNSDVRCR